MTPIPGTNLPGANATAARRDPARKKGPILVGIAMLTVTDFAVVGLVAADSDSAAPRQHAVTSVELDRLFATVKEFEDFSGGVFVAEKGDIVYRRVFGFSHRESGTPMSLDSVFELASISKTFTAVIVHQLVEQGRLSLDDGLNSFFPRLPYPGVTIGGMLSHTSGLFDVYEDPSLRRKFYDFYGRKDAPYTNRDYLAFLERYKPPPLAEPGERNHYSNTAYVLLGLIIEKVTNRPFHEVVRDRILDPVGMRNTLSIRPHGEAEDRRVIHGYRLDPVTGIERDPNPAAGPGIRGNTYGDDELASTLDDMYAYDQALRQGKLLPIARLEEMWQAPRLNDGSIASFGSGFRIEFKNGRRYVRHSGNTSGFWVNHKFSAGDNDNTVIVFSNLRTTRSTINAIHQAIDNILIGLPYDPPRQSIVFPLASSIKESGAATAQKAFLELEKSGQYIVDRQHLEQLRTRYELLGQADAAYAVSQLILAHRPLNR